MLGPIGVCWKGSGYVIAHENDHYPRYEHTGSISGHRAGLLIFLSNDGEKIIFMSVGGKSSGKFVFVEVGLGLC